MKRRRRRDKNEWKRRGQEQNKDEDTEERGIREGRTEEARQQA